MFSVGFKTQRKINFIFRYWAKEKQTEQYIFLKVSVGNYKLRLKLNVYFTIKDLG